MEKCPNCGEPAKLVVKDHCFKESGLSNVVLKGIESIKCNACGEETVLIRRMGPLLRLLAVGIASQPFPLRGEEIRFLRKHLGMTQPEFAALLDIHPTNLSKWENDQEKQGEQSDRLIRLVVMTLDGAPQDKIAAAVRLFPKIRKRPACAVVNVDAEEMSYEYA